jgi:spore coat protein H
MAPRLRRVLAVVSVAVAAAAATSGACGRGERAAHPLEPARPDAKRPPDPNDVGAGHVDSPPLPPLVDRAAAYDPADLGPVDVMLTIDDEKAFRAVQDDTLGARAPVRFATAGYNGGATARGTVELRGHTSRAAIQKSYQIKLAADATPWRGSRTINLLKHPFDLTRVRNALSFDYFRRITGLTSLRIGFVHLFIDAIDHGLYEWVEEPDERYLAAHGLNQGGALYKARNFLFDPIDAATAADGAELDEIVAEKGTSEIAKLRRMAAAVSDVAQPIDDVLAHYFNRENYVTWLAVNVLMSDFDSNSQNFILYSPPGYEGWYFLPWDYDTAWGWNEQPGAPQRPRWRTGIANWWVVVLHRRFLSEPDNVAELGARIADLAATAITDAETSRLMTRYYDIVRSFISVPPDVDHLPCDKQGTADAVLLWEAEYTRIARNASRALAEYGATIDRPMPFLLDAPAFPSSGTVAFSWSPAFHLQASPIAYDIEVNETDGFDPARVLVTATGLTEPRFATSALPSGHFFWRVVARAATNPAVDWQTAFSGHLFVVVP